MQAAYRTPPESKSGKSNASTCRNPVPSQTRQTLNLMREALSPGQIARDLKDLCAMGLVEKIRDEDGITRYRPTGGRIA